jgi:hypothetical protein
MKMKRKRDLFLKENRHFGKERNGEYNVKTRHAM